MNVPRFVAPWLFAAGLVTVGPAAQEKAVQQKAAQQEPASSVLDDARFAELAQLLTPADDVMWRRIPWRIELLTAQQEAVRVDKPLFVWAMDGHPLGCT